MGVASSTKLGEVLLGAVDAADEDYGIVFCALVSVLGHAETGREKGWGKRRGLLPLQEVGDRGEPIDDGREDC